MLVLLIGSTASGKNAVIQQLIEKYGTSRKFIYIISSTTRPMRDYEFQGSPYNFLSREYFVTNKERFVEFEEIHGNYYGLDMESFLDVKNDTSDTIYIKDIGVQGALKVVDKMSDGVVTVWIESPSIDITIERLKARGESSEGIKHRLERIDYEYSFKDKFDYQLVNDDLQKCVEELATILKLEK